MEAAVVDELRPAIELAFHFARSEARSGEGPALSPALKPLLRFSRLPSRALDIVREVVDTDDDFRQRLLAETTEADVGKLGWIWLSRPDGWRDAILTAGEEAVDRRRAERAEGSVKATRRQLSRSDAQLAEAQDQVRRLTDSLAVTDQVAESRSEEIEALTARVEELEAESDGLRGRVSELDRRASRAESNLGDERRQLRELRAEIETRQASVQDSTPPPRTDQQEAAAAAVAEAASKLEAARLLLVRAAEALPKSQPSDGTRPPIRRKPHRLGRALIDDTPEGLHGLMCVDGVRVLIDGYNVAKLGWPDLDLDLQRDRMLIGLASTFARGPCVVDVVFDGAEVVNVDRATRSPNVRVAWSPAGVTADDVLVDKVGQIDSAVAVVVITDDRELRRRCVVLGANTVGSGVLLDILE